MRNAVSRIWTLFVEAGDVDVQYNPGLTSCCDEGFEQVFEMERGFIQDAADHGDLKAVHARREPFRKPGDRLGARRLLG